MSSRIPFQPANHMFHSVILRDVVEEALDFFVKTPVYEFPPPRRFKGTGVYALYYVGTAGIYAKLGQINSAGSQVPIYVGKASAKGTRQGKISYDETRGYEIWSRFNKHRNSIESVVNLNLSDFTCRFMIMLGTEHGLIRTAESALIHRFRPLWNTYVDGFGINDPGSGRAKQLQSEWDSIHPGRGFIQKMETSPRPVEPILRKIERALSELP